MFGVGFQELIFIAIIALIVVGPERLPELARKLGETVRDLRRMYTNLRAELGTDFDDIEQGIRELRALDPRQQLRDYGRGLLDDVAADAPELKQLAAAPKLDIERLGKNVLRDELLDKPLANQEAVATPRASTPRSADNEDELLESLLAASPAPRAEAQPVPSNGFHPLPAAPGTTPAAETNGHAGSAENGNAATKPLDPAGVSDHEHTA